MTSVRYVPLRDALYDQLKADSGLAGVAGWFKDANLFEKATSAEMPAIGVFYGHRFFDGTRWGETDLRFVGKGDLHVYHFEVAIAVYELDCQAAEDTLSTLIEAVEDAILRDASLGGQVGSRAVFPGTVSRYLEPQDHFFLASASVPVRVEKKHQFV